MRKLTKLGIVFGAIVLLFVVTDDYSGDSATSDNDRTAQLNVIIPDKPLGDERFDPVLVKAATDNLPILHDFLKGILQQCNSVKTAANYEVFASVLVLLEDRIADNLKGITLIIKDLKSNGHAQHPEIAALLIEMQSTAAENSDCINSVVARFG